MILSLDFLIRVIISILLILFAVSCVDRVLDSTSTRGEESLRTLSTAIESLEDGERKSIPFTIDKGALFIIFESHAPTYEYGVELDDGGYSLMVEAPRPADCIADQSCLCICIHGLEDTGRLCEGEMMCTTINRDITVPHELGYDDSHFGTIVTKGGMALSQGLTDAEDGGFPKTEQRLNTFYIQRYDETVVLCTDPTCFP